MDFADAANCLGGEPYSVLATAPQGPGFSAEGGEPTSVWCYRDEDFGGSVSSTGRSRGSAMTVSGVSRGVLGKFGMRSMVRMR